MIAEFVTVSGTSQLLLGPVDADYTVTINPMGSSSVGIGGSSSITWAIGSAIYVLPSPTVTQLQIRVGESIYAVAGSSAEISFIAEPL